MEGMPVRIRSSDNNSSSSNNNNRISNRFSNYSGKIQASRLGIELLLQRVSGPAE